MYEYQNGGCHEQWEWLSYLWNEKHKPIKGGEVRVKDDAINAVSGPRRTTNAVSQVLWGYRQRVQGSNGWNAAQLCCPQGPTLTFQHKAGVSWATGLRHGVTMHPRGRHSREGMIPLSHGIGSVYRPMLPCVLVFQTSSIHINITLGATHG